MLPELTEQELLELLPESATNESFPGAVDFSLWFVQESQAVFLTHDTRVFEAVSSPGCTYCDNVTQDLGIILSNGETVEGGQVRAAGPSPTGGLQPDGTWTVTLSLHQEEITYRDASGSITDVVPAADFAVSVSLEFSAQRWWVRDVGAA